MRFALALTALAAFVSCAPKPVTPEPAVNASDVEAMGRVHNHDVLLCYEEALKTNRKLAGQFALELDADATGHVIDTRVRQSLDHGFDDCVLAKAKQWAYPWMKAETHSIQETFTLNLNSDGQPVASFGGPGMDKEAVRTVVRAHLKDVRKCFEKGLSRHPKLAGKLVMEWDILGSGDTTNVVARKSLDPEVDKCMIKQISGWTFPQPPNNMVAKVSYPFLFSPTGAGSGDSTQEGEDKL